MAKFVAMQLGVREFLPQFKLVLINTFVRGNIHSEEVIAQTAAKRQHKVVGLRRNSCRVCTNM